MYEAVECFWVEPNGNALRSLRRHATGPCPNRPGEFSYHSAVVPIGEEFEVVWGETDERGTYIGLIPVEDYAGDPRWPIHCECGYAFKDEDGRQVNQEPVYETADGRRAWTSPACGRKPTPGAMFDTFWRADLRKEDGLAISVVCPNGDVWCIDEQARSGGFWTREGEPPKLTVRPSIVAGDYHGHLIDGVLTAG